MVQLSSSIRVENVEKPQAKTSGKLTYKDAFCFDSDLNLQMTI